MSVAGPMRVVLVVPRFPPAAGDDDARRWRDVAGELARRGHKVTVLTTRSDSRGTSTEDGVRVVRELHAETSESRVSVLTTAADCRRLRRLARHADALLHADPTGVSAALLGVRPGGVRVLCEVSGGWLRELSETGGKWFRTWEEKDGGPGFAKSVRRVAAGVLGAPVRRPTLPPGRAYFTQEEEREAYAAEGLAGADPALLRLGLDLHRFPFAPARTPPVRLLHVADIDRNSGLHTLALAMGDLPRDTRLRTVGDVVDEGYVGEVAELAQAAKVMDRVEFASRVPHSQVRELLAQAHVLVVPSETPGPFPRLVLEAFASGTPVVATPLGGRAEVVREGETGLTFSPGNARDLSNQLLRLLRDAALRDRLVRNARALVESRYALGWTADQLEALLREGLSRSAGSSDEVDAATGSASGANRRTANAAAR